MLRLHPCAFPICVPNSTVSRANYVPLHSRLTCLITSLASSSALSSPASTIPSPTPALEPVPVHVVCNAPLLAPKPLPYRPPAFLEQFDLPDPDEDLSRPPYTFRAKRKRLTEEDEHIDTACSDLLPYLAPKRRATEVASRALPAPASLYSIACQRRISS